MNYDRADIDAQQRKDEMTEQTDKTPATPDRTPATITRAPVTPAVNFANGVQKQFLAQVGRPVVWSDFHQTLGQHLFLKIESSLKKLNEDRKGDAKITWQNINMTELALRSAEIVRFELDGLMKNFVNVVPFKDNST